MPKLTKSAPKYRLHKCSGQAMVTIAGKDHYLGPYGTDASRREWDRLVSDWLAAGRPVRAIDAATGATLDELFLAFIRYAKGYYRKNGRLTNEVAALKNVIQDASRLYGHTPAADFGPLALKAVRAIWIERGQCRTTVNKNMRRLTRIFRWGVAEELIPGGVVHSLTAVPGLKKGRCDLPEPPGIEPVALATVEATLPHLPRVTADMVRFQLLTGARPGEVCRMRPDDIDRSGDVWEYRDLDHKTAHHGRTRTVYIGPEAQSVLMPYLLRDRQKVCFSMSESLEQRRQERADARVTPPSCGNRRGHRSVPRSRGLRESREAFDANSYRHAIHAACNEAFPAPDPLGRRPGESIASRNRRLTDHQRDELKAWQRRHHWHPNQLRHTRATDIRKQFGVEGAQVILGHAAAEVTQIYAERDAEKARSIARAIG
jgi:integrase